MKGLTGRQGGHRTAVDEDPVPRGHMHTHVHMLTRARARTHTAARVGSWREGPRKSRAWVCERGRRAGATGESAEWLISEPRLPKLSL